MSLYLLLNVGSIFIPFLFSFHPRLGFYKRFNAFFPAMLISTAVYISWDVIFTQRGYWGFNPEYLVGVNFLHLPIEEWLFFLCIPFACVFMYYSIQKILPKFTLNQAAANVITYVLIAGLLIVVLFNLDKPYTFINGLSTILILTFAYFRFPESLRSFYPIFLIMLIPFFLINGILTGSFIQDQIVWYNDSANLGIRLFTIPVEDVFYAMGLILLNIVFTEIFAQVKVSFSPLKYFQAFFQSAEQKL